MRRLTAGWPAAAALAAAGLERDGTLPAAGKRPLDRTDRRAARAWSTRPPASASPASRICRCSPSASPRHARAMAPLPSSSMPACPCAAAGPGWLELPDPIREELAREVALPRPRPLALPPRPTPMRASSRPRWRCSRRSGDPDGIAELIATQRWQDLAQLELAELRAILTTLPEEATRGAPGGARPGRAGRRAGRRSRVPRRAAHRRPSHRSTDPRERREVEAELVATTAMVDPGDSVERDAEAILDARGRLRNARPRPGDDRGRPRGGVARRPRGNAPG